MDVQRIPIAQINLAPYNPRKKLRPSDPAYKRIARSLKEFNLVEPLVWNAATFNLVAGHQRLQVMQDQGATEVDVSVVNLSLAREKKLNLALNNIRGEWDQAKLVDLIADLSQSETDLSVTGFDEADLQRLLEFHPGQHAGDFLNKILMEVPPTALPVTPRLPSFVAPNFPPDGLPVGFIVPPQGSYPAASDEQRLEYFQMVFSFTYDQRQLVQSAIQQAKRALGLENSMEALVAICQQYVGASLDA